MKNIVLKFGGTSFRNLDCVLGHIKKYLENDYVPVVVVSAIGRKGEPYATDTLIQQLEKINTNIKPKIKDLIMSCGETISSALIAHLLESNNISAEALMGFQAGIITDNNFSSAEILNIDTSTIEKYMNMGKVVVVAGFQGMTKNKEITTLGRGGSDITAIALGGYLKSERVDIFTDVPGVAIIDPRLVPTTRYIENISFENMYTLSSNGAKVIHPKAVKLAKKFNVPVRITSTYSNVDGTLIYNDDNKEKIIGIAVKRVDNKGIFTIVYNYKFNKSLIESINRFVNENKMDILNVSFNKGKASLIVDEEKISKTAVDLYNHLVSL